MAVNFFALEIPTAHQEQKISIVHFRKLELRLGSSLCVFSQPRESK